MLKNRVFCHVERSLLWLDVHSGKKILERFADFLYKTAFLKSKFKDDPVRVERHNVSHFKGMIYGKVEPEAQGRDSTFTFRQNLLKKAIL